MQNLLTKIKLVFLPGDGRDWQGGMGERDYTKRTLEMIDV